MSSVVRAVVLGLLGANAHSWVHCTDYRGSTDYYEPEKCFGHPRAKNNAYPQQFTFGVDRGFDTQSGVCQGAGGNTITYPMAKVGRGQIVKMAWPSKNHVAATCTNPFIPDTSTKLFVNPTPYTGTGPTAPFTQQVTATFSDDPHVRGTVDFKGFQNCPKFCENTDKSLCTGDFTVPNLPDGVYTFQWSWIFNEGSPPYITCFEAEITGEAVVTPVATPVATPVQAPTAPAPVAPPTTQRPTTATEANCGAISDQCDGVMFSGVNCCQSGLTCQRQSMYFSQCLPYCPPDWECSETGPVASGCARKGDQCDGEFFAQRCCSEGICVKNSPYYSECRTDCPQGWECAGQHKEHFDDVTNPTAITGGWVIFWLIFSMITFVAGGLLVRWWYKRESQPMIPSMDLQDLGRKTSTLAMPPVDRHRSSELVKKPSAPSGVPPPPPSNHAPPRPGGPPPFKTVNVV